MKTSSLIKEILFVLLKYVAVGAVTSVVYLSPHGDDDLNCTKAFPCQSFERGLQVVDFDGIIFLFPSQNHLSFEVHRDVIVNKSVSIIGLGKNKIIVSLDNAGFHLVPDGFPSFTCKSSNSTSFAILQETQFCANTFHFQIDNQFTWQNETLFVAVENVHFIISNTNAICFESTLVEINRCKFSQSGSQDSYALESYARTKTFWEIDKILSIINSEFFSSSVILEIPDTSSRPFFFENNLFHSSLLLIQISNTQNCSFQFRNLLFTAASENFLLNLQRDENVIEDSIFIFQNITIQPDSRKVTRTAFQMLFTNAFRNSFFFDRFAVIGVHGFNYADQFSLGPFYFFILNGEYNTVTMTDSLFADNNPYSPSIRNAGALFIAFPADSFEGPCIFPPEFRKWNYTNTFTIRNSKFLRNFNPVAYGGAIFHKNGKLLIENSLFQDNYAKFLGGTIYIDNGSGSLELTDTRIQTKMFNVSGEFPSRGYAFLSRSSGSIMMDNASLVLGEGFPESINIFDITDGGEIHFKNVTLGCPAGFSYQSNLNDQLVTENPDNCLNNITDFNIFCRACPPQSYSFERGSFSQNISCSPCPNGGVCLGGAEVKARSFYWGYLSPDGTLSFLTCPVGYCCPLDREYCDAYDYCHGHRTGMLCGQCADGYSETIGSSACLETDMCGTRVFDYLYWPIIIMIAFIYAVWFLYEPPFFTYGWQVILLRPVNSVLDSDSPGGYSKTFFYFYQVIPLVFLVESSVPLRAGLQKFLGGLFYAFLGIPNFQFKISDNDGIPGVCPKGLEDLTPVTKSLLAAIIPVFIVTWITVWFLTQTIQRYIRAKTEKETISQFIAALFQCVLNTYSDFSQIAFSFIFCVSIGGVDRLFLDASIVCFDGGWQTAAVTFIVLFILPLPLWLALGARLVQGRVLTSTQFVWLSFFPLLALLVAGAVIFFSWLKEVVQGLKKKGSEIKLDVEKKVEEVVEGSQSEETPLLLQKEEKFQLLPSTEFSLQQTGEEVVAKGEISQNMDTPQENMDTPQEENDSDSDPIIAVLSGAYTKSCYYWESVFISRRLILIVFYTYIAHLLLRTLIISVSNLIFLLHHISYAPLTNPQVNRAETLALLVITIISVLNIPTAALITFGVQIPSDNLLFQATFWTQFVLVALPPFMLLIWTLSVFFVGSTRVVFYLFSMLWRFITSWRAGKAKADFTCPPIQKQDSLKPDTLWVSDESHNEKTESPIESESNTRKIQSEPNANKIDETEEMETGSNRNEELKD